MKQKELAHLVGANTSTISNICNGVRRPSWALAKKLAAETGINVEFWMDNIEEPARLKRLLGEV